MVNDTYPFLFLLFPVFDLCLWFMPAGSCPPLRFFQRFSEISCAEKLALQTYGTKAIYRS